MKIKEIVVSTQELDGVFTKWARDMGDKENDFVSRKGMKERCKEDPERVGKSFTLQFLERLAAFVDEQAS